MSRTALWETPTARGPQPLPSLRQPTDGMSPSHVCAGLDRSAVLGAKSSRKHEKSGFTGPRPSDFWQWIHQTWSHPDLVTVHVLSRQISWPLTANAHLQVSQPTTGFMPRVIQVRRDLRRFLVHPPSQNRASYENRSGRAGLYLVRSWKPPQTTAQLLQAPISLPSRPHCEQPPYTPFKRTASTEPVVSCPPATQVNSLASCSE